MHRGRNYLYFKFLYFSCLVVLHADCVVPLHFVHRDEPVDVAQSLHLLVLPLEPRTGSGQDLHHLHLLIAVRSSEGPRDGLRPDPLGDVRDPDREGGGAGLGLVLGGLGREESVAGEGHDEK